MKSRPIGTWLRGTVMPIGVSLKLAGILSFRRLKRRTIMNKSQLSKALELAVLQAEHDMLIRKLQRCRSAIVAYSEGQCQQSFKPMNKTQFFKLLESFEPYQKVTAHLPTPVSFIEALEKHLKIKLLERN
jgi:hypothetical protein